MSFALLKSLKFNRIPLVRYSARTKRENRLTVQLLRDFAPYGVKGEIIRVLPGLMRNKLYPNNGAAYIIPRLGLGPRIPVVTPEKKPVKAPEPSPVVAKESTPKEVKKVEEFKPVDIKGLLFELPEGTDATGKIEASDESYSLFTLEVSLGSIYINVAVENGKPKSPVTKSDITKQIGSLTGIVVPESDITVISKNNKVNELTELGEFEVLISQDGKDKITKKVIIKSK